MALPFELELALAQGQSRRVRWKQNGAYLSRCGYYDDEMGNVWAAAMCA